MLEAEVNLKENQSLPTVRRLDVPELTTLAAQYNEIRKKSLNEVKPTRYSTGLERLIYTANRVSCPNISPKGTMSFLSDTDKEDETPVIAAIDPQSFVLNQVVIPTSVGIGFETNFTWRPDGTAAACVTRQPANKDTYRLMLCSTDGNTEPEVLVDNPEWYLKKSRPAFSPDGNTLYFDYRMNKSEFIAARNMTTGVVETLFQGESPAVSPDGKKICYTKYENSTNLLYIRELAPGAAENPVIKDNKDCSEPTWSPDGRYIAFTRWEDKEQNLFVVEVESGKAYKLTDTDCRITNPFWTKHGTIYFASYGPRDRGIWSLSPRIDKLR
jgi:Tol biopolymer transport system component